LQAQVDSPRLAEQARAVAPRERASFVQHGSPLPSGIQFDLRSLRYVELDRHAYVAMPTTAADIRSTDAAGESYIVRLHRTPAGHWLLVETVPAGTTTRAVPAATATPVSANLMSQDMAAAPSSCAVNLGTRVPVILVHGWNGSPADWGSPDDGGSMIHVIANMPGVYVEPFDYHQFASSWVTNPAIGPALAKRIDCLARSSLRGGGLGKVILVDHSMGGLATRYAASQSVDGHRVSDELGLVVTIGTPNLGTAWANVADPLVAAVCNSAGTVGPFPSGNPCGDYSSLRGLSKDSAQINTLPWLPPGVPLRAIAGDVTLSATLFNNTVTDDTSSDLLVGVKSALAATQLPTSVDEGTGDRAFHCTIGVTHALDAPCWHVGLLSNPAVQKLVKQSIAGYIANGPWEPFMWDGGKWYVHDAHMTIVPGGHSLLWWSMGPCNINQPAQMCNGNALVSFKPVAGGIEGTYTRVWFTTWTHQPAPSDFQEPPDDVQVGETFQLVPTGLIHWAKAVYGPNSPASWKQGNHNWCQTDINSSKAPPNVCGA
jgi:hypothetical protein